MCAEGTCKSWAAADRATRASAIKAVAPHCITALIAFSGRFGGGIVPQSSNSCTSVLLYLMSAGLAITTANEARRAGFQNPVRRNGCTFRLSCVLRSESFTRDVCKQCHPCRALVLCSPHIHASGCIMFTIPNREHGEHIHAWCLIPRTGSCD